MTLARGTLLFLPLLLSSMFVYAGEEPTLVGSYDMDRMASIKPLTFPRLHLYDRAGKLIGQDKWPEPLENVKKHAGDAFCCVSDKPAPKGWAGPPPDCKIVTYGENVHEHFRGLRNSEGGSIEYHSLPPHKYLVVEYYADWCAPCAPARRALDAFLATPASDGYLAVVVDFSRLSNRR